MISIMSSPIMQDPRMEGTTQKKGKYHFTTIVGTNWEATRTTKLVDH